MEDEQHGNIDELFKSHGILVLVLHLTEFTSLKTGKTGLIQVSERYDV